MYKISEFCSMKKQIQPPHSGSALISVIIGALLTAGLLFLQQFKTIDIELEIVLAPFIVILLLTCWDKIILYFLFQPFGLLVKQFSKTSSNSQNESNNY